MTGQPSTTQPTHAGVLRLAFQAIVFGAVLCLGVQLAGDAFAAEKVRLRIAYLQKPKSLGDSQMKIFAKTLEEKAPGYFDIGLFPGGQLGTGSEQLQGVATGTIEAAALGSEGLSVDPKMGIVEIPWLIRDHAHYRQIVSGPWFDEVAKVWRGKNMQLVAMYGWGFRNILTREPAKTLADFKGKKIRLGPSPARIKFFKALGTVPVTMQWASTYLALQQGTVDGIEAYPTFLRSGKMYENAKYLDMINYTAGPTFVTFNKQFFDKLPKKIQSAVVEAGRASMGPANDLIASGEKADIDFMVSKGVTVLNTDLAGKEKIQAVLKDAYVKKNGDAWLKLWGVK